MRLHVGSIVPVLCVAAVAASGAFAQEPRPTVSVRSAVASRGTEVALPLDVGSALRGVRRVEATFRVRGGASAVAVRSVTVPDGGAFAAPLVTRPDPADPSCVHFVIATVSDVAPALDGPAPIATLSLVVSSSAATGASYVLELSELSVSGASGPLASEPSPGTLTIGVAPPPVVVDRLALAVPARVAVGSSGELTVLASGEGLAIPGVGLSVAASSDAVALATTSGTTGTDGRLRVAFTATKLGPVVVTATSPGVADARTSFSVVDVVPPRITSTPPLDAVVGAEYRYAVVTDPAGLALVLEKAPAGMTLDAGAIRWTPAASQQGANDVVVRGATTDVSQTFSVFVEGSVAVGPNRAPRITTAPPATAIHVGETFRYDVDASDEDGDRVTFSLEQGPAGLALDASTGVVTWTPAGSDVGDRRAVVTVTDGRGGLDAQTLVFSVTPPVGDAAPVIASSGTTSASVGQTYTYQVVATDAEQQGLTFRLVAAPEGMKIDGATGLVTWTPTTTGTPTVTVEVRDAVGNVSQQSFTITVGATGSLVAIPAALDFGDVRVGETVRRTVSLDVSGQAIVNVDAATVPGTASPFAATLRESGSELVVDVTFAPTTVASSASEVRVAWGAQVLSIALAGRGVAATTDALPRFVSIPSATAIVGREWVYASRATDPSGGGIGYSLLRSPEGASVNAQSGVVRWTPRADQTGPVELEVGATDSLGRVARQTVRVVALAVALETTATPVLAPVGRNDVLVLVKLTVAPPRLVVGPRGATRALFVEHEVPADLVATVQFVNGTPAPDRATATAKGTRFAWFVPVRTATLAHAVRVDALAATARDVSVASTARLLADAVIPAGSGFGFTRSFSTLPFSATDVRGIALDPVARVLHLTNPSSGRLLRTDLAGSLVGSTSTGLAGEAIALVASTQRSLVLDANGRRAVELVTGGDGTPTRSTRTDGFAAAPSGLAVDPRTGEKYVVDASANALFRLDRRFGEHSSLAGLPFSATRTEAVACDPETGELWIADWDRARVYRLDAQGNHLASFTIDDQIGGASGIDFDPLLRRLLIVGSGNRVFEYGLDGTLLRTTRIDATVASASGVRRDPRTGELLVSDRAKQRVFRLGAQLGDHVTLLGLPAGATRTEGVARDPATGDLWVGDRDRGVVYRLDASGAYRSSFSVGDRVGDLSGIELDAKRRSILVTGPSSGRIFEYALDGTFRNSTRTAPTVANATGVRRDPRTDEVLVCDRTAQKVFRFGPQLLDHVSLADLPFRATRTEGVARDPSTGDLWTADGDSGRIYRLDAQGRHLSSFPVGDRVSGLSGVELDSARRQLLVVGSGSDRVHEYALDGTFLRSTRVGATVANATGIRKDPATGEVLISDSARQCVHRLGAQLGDHVSLGDLPFSATRTEGVARDPATGDLWCVDSDRARVYHLDASGTYLGSFDVGDRVSGASGIELDAARGRLLVVGVFNDRFFEYGLDGTFVRSTRIAATVANATGIRRDPVSGELLVSDATAGKVFRMGAQLGEHSSLADLPFTASRVEGVARDATNGDLWVADYDRARVYRLDAAGNHLANFFVGDRVGAPGGLEVDRARDRVLVLDRSGRRIEEYSLAGAHQRSTRLDDTVVDPTGLRLDPATGEYLVADANQKRVFRMGAQLTDHSSLDRLPGSATNTQGVTRDPATGHLWTVDADRGAVYELDAAGAFASQFSIGAQVGAPTAIAFDASTNELLVLDASSRKVVRFTTTGTSTGSTALSGRSSPTGLCVSGASWLVTDSGDATLSTIDPATGVASSSFSTSAFGSSSPQDVTIGPDGHLFIADAAARKVFEVSATGTLRGSFSTSAFGAFSPMGLAFDGTNLRIADTSADRLFTIGPRGLPVSSFSTQAFSSDPEDVAVAADSSRLVIADGASGALVEVAADGTLPGVIATRPFGCYSPCGVVFDGSNYRVADVSDDRLFTIAPRGLPVSFIATGSFGSGNPQDVAIAANPANLVVLDGSTARLHEVTKDGTLVSSVTLPPFGCFAPAGVVFDGTNYRVADTSDDRLFAVAPGGLPVSSFATTSFGSGNPQDVAIAADPANLVVLDAATVRLYEVTRDGALVSSIELAPSGCVAPFGVVFDGASYRVTDTSEDQLFTIAPGGLAVSSFSTASVGCADPQDIAFGPTPDEIVVADPSASKLFRVSATGSLLGTIATGPFGCFSPFGLVFDGTNYRVADTNEDRLFAISPDGLPVSSFATTAYGQGRPEDLALHPTRGTIFTIDPDRAELAEVTTDGTLVARHDLRPLGIFAPMGLAFDQDGELRVSDPGEDRLFRVSPDGVLFRRHDLGALGLVNPQGIAWDEKARTALVVTGGGAKAPGLHELAIADASVTLESSFDLSTYASAPTDVTIDSVAGEVYVSDAGNDQVLVFARSQPRELATGKVLVLLDGPDTGLARALEARGHAVVLRALDGAGVLAASLDATFSQVWIVSSDAASGARLGASDLDALEAWRRTTGRAHVTIDALAARSNEDGAGATYTQNLAAVIEAAGGGLLLATGAEQPTVNPADGSGLVVATANQVLDRIGFARVTGSYVTSGATLVGTGDVFDRMGAPVAPASLVPGDVTHAALPAGAQPNGALLQVALAGTYHAQTSSLELPDRGVNLLVSTIARASSAADASTGATRTTGREILSLAPAQHDTVAGDAATFILTVKNVRSSSATFDLLVSDLPEGWTGTVSTPQVIAAEEERAIVVTVATVSSSAPGVVPFRVRALEHAGDERRDRGSVAGTVTIVDPLYPLAPSLAPAAASGRSGDALTFSVTATNSSPRSVRLAFELLGTSACAASVPALSEIVAAPGERVSVPFSLALSGAAGAHVIGVRAFAPDDAGVLAGVATATVVIEPSDAAPVALAGPDRTVAVAGSTALVPLDGSASYDPEGASLTYAWTLDDGTLLTGATPVASLVAGAHVVTLVVSDGRNASSPARVTIQVGDTAPPEVGPASDVTVEGTSPDGTTVTFATPLVSDDTDPAPSVTCSPPSGSAFPLGATVVRVRATDRSGNVGELGFVVNVVDTTAPTLSVVSDVTVLTRRADGDFVTYPTPTPADACDPEPRLECTPASGSFFPLGTTRVLCRATDLSGNVGETSFTVTVIRRADTVAPTLSVALPAEGALLGSASVGARITYSDDADGWGVRPSSLVVLLDGVDVSAVFSTATASVASATLDVSPDGTHVLRARVSDEANNASAEVVRTFTVDTTPPVITLVSPAEPIVVEQEGPAGTALVLDVRATDAIDSAPVLSNNAPSVFPAGTTLVTTTAQDAVGHVTTRFISVTVRDTTGPAIAPPEDIVVEAAGPAGTAVTYPAPSVADAVDPAPTIAFDPPSGTVFALGTNHRVTLRAVDRAGNASEVVFLVSVVDTTPPRLSRPGDIVVEQASAAGTAVTFPAPSVQDAVDPSPVVTFDPASGTVFAQGSHLLTVTATDASGNRAATTFTVTVRDTTPPTLSVPLDLTIVRSTGPVTASDPEIAAWLAQARATDAVDPSPAVTNDASSFPLGATTTVHFRAADSSRNEARAESRVTVRTDGLTVRIVAPDTGTTTSAGVTVTCETTGSPTSVQLAGTRRKGDSVEPAGPGTTYSLEGDYAITATATRGSESAVASVAFTIDRTSPVVTITSPRAVAHPGAAYPEDQYAVALPSGGDLPIAVAYAATDDDGISGGVQGSSVLLDGCVLPSGTTALTRELLESLDLSLLGRHVLEVRAWDAAGNVGRATVAFEVVLVGPIGSGVLTVKAESLEENGGVLTAFLELPRCADQDARVRDVVASTLRLRAVATGRIASPTKVHRDGDRLVLKFRRSDLASRGSLGKEFVLTARLFTTTGPALVARDTVRRERDHDHDERGDGHDEKKGRHK